jgi:hypothetical protein
MLDPVSILSVVAAASQLIEQSGKLVLFFSELYWKVEDTPDLIRKQKIHIEQLILLSGLVKENPSLQTAPIASILQSCLKNAQPLYEVLTKISISDGDGKAKRIQKIISALMKEKHISASLSDLERQKNSLVLCIQEIDSYVMFTLYVWICHLIRDQEAATCYPDHRRGGENRGRSGFTCCERHCAGYERGRPITSRDL